MNFTFIEALAHCNKSRDNKSKIFLEYILLKYFNNKELFMEMGDAVPYLDNGDLEIFLPIAKSIKR